MKLERLNSIILKNSKNATLSIANIKEPYGVGSEDVLSLAICLKENKADWKIHIPYDNLDELIIALEQIKEKRQ